MTILGNRVETSHTSSIFVYEIRSLSSLKSESLQEHGRRSEKTAEQSGYEIDRS